MKIHKKVLYFIQKYTKYHVVYSSKTANSEVILLCSTIKDHLQSFVFCFLPTFKYCVQLF